MDQNREPPIPLVPLLRTQMMIYPGPVGLQPPMQPNEPPVQRDRLSELREALNRLPPSPIQQQLMRELYAENSNPQDSSEPNPSNHG